jgi:hypothetical protein
MRTSCSLTDTVYRKGAETVQRVLEGRDTVIAEKEVSHNCHRFLVTSLHGLRSRVGRCDAFQPLLC